MDPVLEQHLLEHAGRGDLNPNTLSLDPDRAERLIQEANQLSKRMISNGQAPILLTSPVLRSTLYNFLAPSVPDIAVLSYNDLVPDASVEVVDQLKLV
jgi:flagellar biosynthesis protein FlhA